MILWLSFQSKKLFFIYVLIIELSFMPRTNSKEGKYIYVKLNLKFVLL